MERARNAAICARVQVPVGSKRPLPTPVVMPLSTAQDTAPAYRDMAWEELELEALAAEQ